MCRSFLPVVFVGLILVSAENLRGQHRQIDRSIEFLVGNLKHHSDEKEFYELLNEMAHKARQAAYSIVILGEEAEMLVQAYGTGEYGKNRKEFAKQMKKTMKELRKHIRPIEEVHFLDPNENNSAEAFEQAGDLEQLKQRLESLNSVGLALRSKIDSFFGVGVDVAEFEESSLESLTKTLKDLSKVIEKSSKKI